MTNFEITPMHLDILKEIGNIGAGNAATALSKLLQQKIEMHVPDVHLVSFEEMFELAGGAEQVSASIFLRIEGDITGTMFFILSMESANLFIRNLIQDPTFDFENEETAAIGASALQELGNILSGSYLSSLSDFTRLNIYPTVPSLAIDMVGAIVSFGLVELSQYSDEVIVIDTRITQGLEDGTSTFAGHFFLLPDPPSYEIIFKSLGVM